MNLGIFAFTATTIIFTGLAVLLYLVMRLWKPRSAKLPKRYWRIIWVVMLGGLVYTAIAERFALAWRAWAYNPERTFYTIFLGAEVENYLFVTLVSFVVSLATLLYARHEDNKR